MSKYGLLLATTCLALLIVALLNWALGLPPLVLLIAPVTLSLLKEGILPAILALTLTIFLGDYMFIEPTGEVTFHKQGILLTLSLCVGAIFTYFAKRIYSANPLEAE